jgi:hypothetical protein
VAREPWHRPQLADCPLRLGAIARRNGNEREARHSAGIDGTRHRQPDRTKPSDGEVHLDTPLRLQPLHKAGLSRAALVASIGIGGRRAACGVVSQFEF